MGYQRHHTIVVTTINLFIKEVHQKAKEIFGTECSEIVSSGLNGVYSFFIAPDGSKENRQESENGDKRRSLFIEWINAQADEEDGSNCISFFEVFYGDEEGNCEIINHN